MNKHVSKLPKTGDLIFVLGRGPQSKLSPIAQMYVDPLARDAKARFSHVCVAISDTIAIEAMPTASPDQARWSGVRLSASGYALMSPRPSSLI
jgi:hypothetical protein